ncbi:MAG: Fe-S cluster assembly protein SufD [Chlorobi bacterium]|nr:Fe-S cluster assembly protein SufD [Chlorobiota bacterium]
MPKKTENILQDNILEYYRENESVLNSGLLDSAKNIKEEAFSFLTNNKLPDNKDEKWRNTDLSSIYSQKLTLDCQAEKYDKSIDEIFVCEVHGFESLKFSMLNGWFYSPDNEKIKVFENGLVVGSMIEAQKQFPEIFEKYFNSVIEENRHGLIAANSLLANDGLFVYVPDNLVVDDSVQLIKMLNREENLFVNSRNLIILGKNSKLSFLHCDDSINHSPGFLNTVTEIVVCENAHLHLNKLQNLNDSTSMVNSTFINQYENSNITVNVITYNGGLIRNELKVNMLGQGSHADLNGIYLMDKSQHIDNQVFVNHAVPNCSSSELFKGVLDNRSSGVFNGYIFVGRNAQNTSAFQQNNNILMSSDAKIDTQPFLEIYADDVKCSHGATVGQLDTEALFYMKQRGIGDSDARLLLMFAFTAEVTSKINIEALRLSIEDMIKKRLRGELSICDKCVLHCSVPDMPPEFDIDLSKI